MKLTLEDDRSQSESNTDVSDGETVLGRKLMIMNYGEAVMTMNLFIQIHKNSTNLLSPDFLRSRVTSVSEPSRQICEVMVYTW